MAGRYPVLLDGGVRRGTDVLAALALGTHAVLVGRPVLHALAAGSHQEVGGDVLGTLTGELAGAMVLTGTATMADADASLLVARAPDAAAGVHATSRVPAATERTTAEAAERDTFTDGPAPPGLRREELHRSLSDPVLTTMNFLNEITSRFPEAVSFTPGRPYEGFFETEDVLGHIRRYLDHLADQGATGTASAPPCTSTGRRPGRSAN